MKSTKNKRRSHCTVCGKRLSEKTESGEIRWQPSHVDDGGILCEACAAPPKKRKSRSGTRAKGT